ncbi:Apoptotic protease-activating factor 1 [Rhizoctonia solani]|uniref:Apoptotic protease-activating factor 1 n=1 Tax=Rhizoctonia solani TaxID=456999 RepID=A0A0K6GIN0_9AGAM|nr:Apoptotic protease-activating factor 1 [Rhizoctonia solani]
MTSDSSLIKPGHSPSGKFLDAAKSLGDTGAVTEVPYGDFLTNYLPTGCEQPQELTWTPEQQEFVENIRVVQKGNSSEKADEEREPTYRLNMRVATQDVGRALSEARTLGKFLAVMYDVCVVQRNQYRKSKILHRDISDNNIMIAPKGDKRFHGPCDGGHDQVKYLNQVLTLAKEPRPTCLVIDLGNGADLESQSIDPGLLATRTPKFIARSVSKGRLLHLTSSGVVTMPRLTRESLQLYTAGDDSEYEEYNRSVDDGFPHDPDEAQFAHQLFHDAESTFWVIAWFLARAAPKAYQKETQWNPEFRRFVNGMKSHHPTSDNPDPRWAFFPVPEYWKEILHPELASMAPMLSAMHKYILPEWGYRPELNAEHAHEALMRLLLVEIVRIRDTKADIEFATGIRALPLPAPFTSAPVNKERSRLQEDEGTSPRPSLWLKLNDTGEADQKLLDEALNYPWVHGWRHRNSSNPNDHLHIAYHNMPSGWYKRQKDKFKRALALNSSSASLSNPSNAPPPASPLPRVVVNTGLGDTLGTLLTPSESIKSLPNPDVGPMDVPESHKPTVTDTSTFTDDIPDTEAKPQGMAWPGLKSLVGIIRAGAGGFGPLESALKGLERCADIFEAASKARDDYQELRKKLDQLLGDLAQFNHTWMNKAMTASVKNLCSGIEAEIKVIEEKQGKKVLGRYMGAIEDSDAIIECYRRINGHVERLLLNANLNLWKTFDEEMTDRRLLQMSPTMSGAYDSWAADRTKRRRCADETRESELERLKTWARDPSAEPVYWINGMAGTGKTTIAYTLCDELDKTDELAASFFCTRLLPECRDIRLIIPAIAYQLSRFSYPFRHALSKVFESDQMAHTRGLQRQFQMLIDTPMQAVKQTLPPGIIAIIDALDECEDRDNIEKLLELLVASTANSPIRFLVSSRPEPEIYRRMMQQVGGTPDAKLVLHELNPFDVQHDIETYLRQELQDLLLTIDQWDGLLRRCGTLFIYASTACRFIKSGDEMMSFEEAMDMVLGLSTGTAGAEKELDKLYTAILESAFNRPQISDENKKRMKTVLDTVICAQEPMSTETLAGLLELKNAEHARTLLRPLLSVVNVTEDTGLATTLHASFPDFMLSAYRSAGFYCAATQHHIILALACLKRIRSNPVQFNICGIKSSYLLKAEIKDLNKRAEHAIPSALFYACCHWHNHLELADHSSEFREPLFDFFSARFLSWLEVMHMTSESLNQLPNFKKAEKWCREACMPKGLVELAQDAWEFITYQDLGMGRAADIYISQLLFWPSTSPISSYYAPRTTGMPQLRGPAIAHPELPHLASWYIGDPIETVCYCSDGARIVVAVGSNIHIVDESTGQTILGPLKGHTDLVTCLAASPNGLYIVSGSYDATIQIWDAKDGKLVTNPIKAHPDRVTSVAFSPDSTRIVSTGAFAPLCVWSVPYGEHIVSASVETESLDCVRTAVFSADASFIISGDDDGSIAYWDAYTGNLISRKPNQHSARINSVSISSDGLRFVSASEDATIYSWDTKTQRAILGPLESGRNCKKAMFSPNDRYIASYGEPDEIFLWEAGTGRSAAVIYRGPQVRKQVKSISFSPDSSRLSSCADDGTISIWDIQSATRTTDLAKRVKHGIHSACFTSDGSQIVTGERTGSVCLWDTQNGQLVMGPLTGHNGYICSVAISFDGAYIASASSDKTIRLWDVKYAKGTCKVIEHHTKRADLLQFTADGSQLLYGSVVYSIGDPFSSEIAPAPRSNARDEWATEVLTDDIDCNASSPDGLLVASGFADGTVQIRDSRTHQLILGPVWAHTRAVSRILFSPDGTHIVSCSLDNTMRFWPIPGKSKRKGLGSDTADNDKGIGPSPSPDLHWKLDDDGWIINDSDQVILHVPYHLVPYLLLPENDRLISHRGWFSTDFTGANIGKLWTRCYRPVQ